MSLFVDNLNREVSNPMWVIILLVSFMASINPIIEGKYGSAFILFLLFYICRTLITFVDYILMNSEGSGKFDKYVRDKMERLR